MSTHLCNDSRAEALLSERRLGEFEYVSGERQYPGDPTRRSSHARLEQSGLIIDITAVQFEEVDDPVLVTRDSAWHCSWTLTHRRVADFRAAGSCDVGTLERVYKAAVIRADAGSRAVAAVECNHQRILISVSCVRR